MIQHIYIIDQEDELCNKLNELFDEEGNLCFKKINEFELDVALKNIPELIIINEDGLSYNKNVIDLCNEIKDNEDNLITPVIIISSNTSQAHILQVLKASVEHYIVKPIDNEYLYYTILNIIKLIDFNRTASPLTGLPGNVQIQAEMKKRLMNNDKFVMLYFDLDNFKAYNDMYGFVKGDEVIKFTAKTIVKNVHEIDPNNCFVGHIGGDDFVAIISNDEYENLCQNIIVDFDYNVLDFYSKEHIEKGYIEMENRRGIVEQFPIVSLSIGVVEVDENYKNILEIGEVGAQVKHASKTIPGSTYVVNKRKML